MNTQPTIAAPYGPLERVSRRSAHLAPPRTQSAAYGQPEALAGGTKKRRNRLHRPWKPGGKGERIEHQQQEREQLERRRQERERQGTTDSSTLGGVLSSLHPSDHHTDQPKQQKHGSARQTTAGALDPASLAVAGRVAKTRAMSRLEAPLSVGACPLATSRAGLLGAQQLEGQLAQPALAHERLSLASPGGGAKTSLARLLGRVAIVPFSFSPRQQLGGLAS